ncbi:MAG: efflux RND transporter periplasmic adaptor subunit [Betaproteobacteria bacterium]|nr:efflux RND transporter periplasmic adaptor subunit [Betaproteobacteria bacterium]
MPTKRLPRATRRYAALCTLLSAAAIATHAAHAAEPPISAPVQTVPARLAPLAQTVRAYGIASMAPADVTDVNVPFTARIARLWVSAGQHVVAGAPLADLAPDPAALLAYRQASSAADLARSELARTEKLYEQQLATQSQLAQARKAVSDADQALAAQRQLGAMSAQQRIKAPAEGVVVALSATQGAQIQAGAPLMQLARTGAGTDGARARILLGVEPADSARVRDGMPVMLRPVTVSAGGSPLRGTVQMVGRAIDPQTQLVNVAVGVTDPGAVILPGARLAADISISQGEHWIVPRPAVLRDATGDYVFQINNGRAQRVGVTTVVDQGASLGVDGPINRAWPIVATGNYELKDGMAVRITGGAR